jgi:hypothetical protein
VATPFKFSQLAKKLRLEAVFEPKLAKFFRDIASSITPVYNVTGRMPQTVAFKDDLVELLEKHYGRVTRSFRGDVAPNITKSVVVRYELKQTQAEEIIDEAEEDVNAALLALIAVRAPRQADFILATVEKELNDAADKIINQAAIDGEALTRREIGRAVEKDFRARIPSKVDTISTLETQAVAEDTKFVEAETIVATGAIIAGVSASLATKTWNSILDEVTRTAHVLADNQERSTLEPFIVGGQRLKVPGDTSLGATLSNVINCRCAASYGIG